MKLAALIIGSSLVLGGCRAHNLQNDQMDMRSALLEMYEEQMIDNLRRTKLMLPIVQIDYKTMTGTASSASKGTFGVSRTLTKVAGAEGSRTLAVDPTVGGEQNESVQITITGDPVTDPKIYEAYEQYVYGKHGATDTGIAGVPATAPTEPPKTPVTYYVPKIDNNGPIPNVAYQVVLTAADFKPQAPDPKPLDRGEISSSKTKPADGTYHGRVIYRDGYYWYVPASSAAQYWALYKAVVLRGDSGGGGGTAAASALSPFESIRNSAELFRLNQELQNLK